MSTANRNAVTQFRHTDGDGDRLLVLEGELGAVLYANSHDHEQVVIAVRGTALEELIEALDTIRHNVQLGAIS